jgi:hypothetical protein
MTRLSRAEAAFANDIRGNAPKQFGKEIARVFGKPLLDMSSGDLPKCFGPGHFKSIDAAISNFPPISMAYDHDLYSQAQDAVWSYLTGLPGSRMEKERDRVHAIPGISGFMGDVIGICAEAMGFRNEYWHRNSPTFVLIPPVHPHWTASIAERFGYGSIVTIRRRADGLPDLEDAERVFKSLKREFVVIMTPDENPAGVCTPNSFLFNDEQTGVLNRIRNHTRWGIFLFDAIYMDTSWGENAGRRQDVINAIEGLGVRAFVMHSLSKTFMKPGARIGGVAYLGPTDKVGAKIVRGLLRVVDGKIKNGISAPSLCGLIEAYSGKDGIRAEMEDVVGQIRARVEENEGLLNVWPIGRAYPQSRIESAFYGWHSVATRSSVPWQDPEYQQWLVDRVEAKFKENGFFNMKTEVLWAGFRKVVGAHGLTPSHAFGIELAMNGLQVLPGDPFFPLFTDDAMEQPYRFTENGENPILFRTVLAYEREKTELARDTMLEMLERRIGEYNSSKAGWRKAYP